MERMQWPESVAIPSPTRFVRQMHYRDRFAGHGYSNRLASKADYSFVPFMAMDVGGRWRRYCSRQITLGDRNHRNSPAHGSDV